MSARLDAIRELERLADLAYPAGTVTDVGGWRYRLDADLGRRVNSVSAPEGDVAPLGEQIDHAEAWYRDRSRRPIFKLTEASQPPHLDASLAGRGYLEEAAVWVMVRDIAPGRVEPGVRLEPVGSARWRDALCRISGKSAERVSMLPDLVARAEGPAAYASVARRGMVVGVSLAVVAEDHLGLFEVFVDAAHRRRGIGRHMMGALCAWGTSHGARRAFLQVEEENAAARRFYRALGFCDVYRYWYRVPPDGPD